MTRKLLLAFCASALLACSGSEMPMSDAGGNADTAPPEDSGMMTGEDAMEPADTGTMTMRDFGTCGASLHACFCECNNNEACAQQCLGTSSRACQTCYTTAQAMCCPAETNAFNTCVQTNMCTDLACARSNCAAEVTALEGCLQRGAMDPACVMRIQGCVGTDQMCP